MIDDSTDDGWSVLELSSFQLEAATTFRAHVGVILNLTPDHIDRHGSFGAYVSAKARLLAAQHSEDVAVLNAGDPPTRELAPQARGQVWWFSRTELAASLDEISLPGRTSIARALIEDWFGGPIDA